MNMNETALLQILAAFVNGTAPEIRELDDIGGLFGKAYAHNVQPIIAYMNSKYHFVADRAVDEKLTELLYRTIYISANRFADFESLSQRLSEEGIAHMPVKGWYIKELYPIPELRTFGDIDILIRREDRERSNSLMLQSGYKVKQDWEPSFSYQKGNEYYELHTELIDAELNSAPRLADYFSKAWDYAVGDGGERYRLKPEYHFIYIVCHLAKHLYGGGAGLRMYLDIALYIKNESARLNMENIEREMAALQLTGFFHTLMNACSAWFGTECGCSLPPPDEAAIKKLLCYTLDSDLFGHSRDHAVIELRNSKSKKTAKGKLIRNMLFPPAGQIESRYTFLQGRHWLLPLAWIVRAVSNLRLIPNRLRSMKSVAETDIDRVETYDGFMRRIGL